MSVAGYPRPRPLMTHACVRKARLDDVAAILALETVFPATDRVTRRALRRLIGRPTVSVLVNEDVRLTGAAILLYRSTSRAARLYSLAVAPEARGRGIGQTLLMAAAEDAQGRGADCIRLEVRASNEPAIALYARSGFQFTGSESGYYDDGEDALKLELPLPVREPRP